MDLSHRIGIRMRYATRTPKMSGCMKTSRTDSAIDVDDWLTIYAGSGAACDGLYDFLAARSIPAEKQWAPPDSSDARSPSDTYEISVSAADVERARNALADWMRPQAARASAIERQVVRILLKSLVLPAVWIAGYGLGGPRLPFPSVAGALALWVASLIVLGRLEPLRDDSSSTAPGSGVSGSGRSGARRRAPTRVPPTRSANPPSPPTDDDSGGRMQLVITGVDYAPSELEDQVPIIVDLIREIPGPDRPDYWLGRVQQPIRWSKDGQEISVTHVVLAARWVGTSIGPGARNLPVGIAYVTDPTLLEDSELDFSKCVYVAIGSSHEANASPDPEPARHDA